MHFHPDHQRVGSSEQTEDASVALEAMATAHRAEMAALRADLARAVAAASAAEARGKKAEAEAAALEQRFAGEQGRLAERHAHLDTLLPNSSEPGNGAAASSPPKGPNKSSSGHPDHATPSPAAPAAAIEEHLAVLHELAELRAVREAVSQESVTLKRSLDDAVAKKRQYKELARAAQDEVRRLRTDLASRVTEQRDAPASSKKGSAAKVAAVSPSEKPPSSSSSKRRALPPSRGALGDRTNDPREN